MVANPRNHESSLFASPEDALHSVSNEKRKPRLPKEIKKKEYEFKNDQFDLSAEQIAETLRTYAEHPTTYSKGEWSRKTVANIWRDFYINYKDVIKSLPTGAKVKVLGVGTARDLVILKLLRTDFYVYGSDIVPVMLEESRKKLTWENVIMLFKFIGDIDKKLGTKEKEPWTVNKVILLVQALLEELIHVDPEIDISEQIDSELINSELINSQNIANTFINRTYFTEEDVRQLKDEENTYDFVIAIAVDQHLSKGEINLGKGDLIKAISEGIRVLKPGRIFHFDLRADEEFWETAEHGRTFRDSVLGGNRFYTTYTKREVDILVAKLEQMYPGMKIEVDKKRTKPSDRKKPRFIQFKMTKAPEIPLAA